MKLVGSKKRRKRSRLLKHYSLISPLTLTWQRAVKVHCAGAWLVLSRISRKDLIEFEAQLVKETV
jgi:hypothetical protein